MAERDQDYEDLDESLESASDEGGTYDVDDENWDDGEGASEAQPKKKKKGSSNLMIIGLGVLVFLGFVYFKFSTAPTPSDLQAVDQAVPEVAATEPAVVADAAPEAQPPAMEGEAAPMSEASAVPEMPVADNMSSGEGAEINQAAPEMNIPPQMGEAPPMEPVPMMPVTGGMGTMPVEVPAVMPTAPEPDPAQAEIQAPPAAPSFDGIEVTPSMPSEQAAEGAPSNDGQMVASDRVQKLEAELVALREKIGQSTSGGGDRRELAKIATQLETLADRLSALETQVAKNGRAERSSGRRAEAEEKEPAPFNLMQRFNPAERSSSSARETTRTAYTLKAASQGKAYLTRAGDQKLMTVQVGDDVEGLGQIQSIQLRGGRWVVTGSSGRVRQ